MSDIHDWYTNPTWRAAYIEETILSLSKTGSLGNDEVLFELATVLPKGDVIEFYNALRESRRLEAEWRDEFLSIFTSIRENDLPPILHDDFASVSEEDLGPPRAQLDIQSDEDIPF